MNSLGPHAKRKTIITITSFLKTTYFSMRRLLFHSHVTSRREGNQYSISNPEIREEVVCIRAANEGGGGSLPPTGHNEFKK